MGDDEENIQNSTDSSESQPVESSSDGQAAESTPSKKSIDLKQKPSTDASNGEKKENTRSQIAKIYVKAFFAVIFVVIFVCCLPVAQGNFKDFRDMLVTVSGILSGPLGFIIGYYFKSGEN